MAGMKITETLDKMIDQLHKAKTPAEYIIMGRRYFYDWMIEISRTGSIALEQKSRKYKFTHKGIKIIVCESDILEAVPNAKYLLQGI